MPTITPPKLQAAFNSLHELTVNDKSKGFVFKSPTRIKLGTDFRRVRDLLSEVVKEQDELVRKYGVPSPGKPGEYMVEADSPKRPEFNAEQADLMSSEFELELQTITSAELFNARKVKTRSESGQVIEEEVENQISLDSIADLQAAGILTE